MGELLHALVLPTDINDGGCRLHYDLTAQREPFQLLQHLCRCEAKKAPLRVVHNGAIPQASKVQVMSEYRGRDGAYAEWDDGSCVRPQRSEQTIVCADAKQVIRDPDDRRFRPLGGGSTSTDGSPNKASRVFLGDH